MAQKKKAVTAHDLDRIIVRLPPGMRERLNEMSKANGRSVTAEVVAALSKHLESVDQINDIWNALENRSEGFQHQIDEILFRIKALEGRH